MVTVVVAAALQAQQEEQEAAPETMAEHRQEQQAVKAVAVVAEPVRTAMPEHPLKVEMEETVYPRQSLGRLLPVVAVAGATMIMHAV